MKVETVKRIYGGIEIEWTKSELKRLEEVLRRKKLKYIKLLVSSAREVPEWLRS